MNVFIFLRKSLLLFIAILATGCVSHVRVVNQNDMEATHPLMTRLGTTKEEIIAKYGAPLMVYENENILIYRFSDLSDDRVKNCRSYDFVLKFKDNRLVKTGSVCKE